MTKVRTDLHGYAAKPLEHLANSLGPLAHRFHQVTWNTLRLDWPESYEGFFQDKPSLCMETPLFGRNLWQFDGSKDPERTFYRIALHDPGSSRGTFDLRPCHKRAEHLRRTLGIEIQPWRESSPGAPVIYAMQVPDDTSLKGLNVFRAACYDIAEIRRHTKRDILISIHPDCKTWASDRMAAHTKDYETLVKIAHHAGATITPEPASILLEIAHCLVCHSSGTAAEAILDGIPAVVLSDHSFTKHWGKDVCEIERAAFFLTLDRHQFMAHYARIQWSWAEIERGEHLESIKRLR